MLSLLHPRSGLSTPVPQGRRQSLYEGLYAGFALAVCKKEEPVTVNSSSVDLSHLALTWQLQNPTGLTQ